MSTLSQACKGDPSKALLFTQAHLTEWVEANCDELRPLTGYPREGHYAKGVLILLLTN